MKWKNIAADTTTYFITATITNWQPLFLHEQVRQILLNDFNFYRKKYDSRILAYVIMPEHYHIIVDLNQPQDLPGWLRDVQSHSGNEIMKWLQKTALSKELTIFNAHANGKSKLAIWKEQARALGIVSERVLHTKIAYIHANPVRRGLVEVPESWQWSSWRNYNMGDESVFRVDRVEML